jgi:hypothetical protein
VHDIPERAIAAWVLRYAADEACEGIHDYFDGAEVDPDLQQAIEDCGERLSERLQAMARRLDPEGEYERVNRAIR